MNYLLFVYNQEDIKTSLETTEKIGGELSKIMSSNQVKFMFGDRHAIQNTNKKKQTPPKKIEFNLELEGGEEFSRMADTIMKFLPKKECELTMDELLDKISSQGMDSLTEEEKCKLDEYSKNY